MKKIKVYLQYPWKFPDSPYYKYLINYPPEGIEFLNIKNEGGAITKASKFKILNSLKHQIRFWTNKLNLVMPNAHLTESKEEFDLIHCAHCLSKNNNKPWVADLEGIWSMWISGQRTKRGKREVKDILSRKNCKKIMPWTESGYKEIIETFPEIKDKVELVYPAVPFFGKGKKNKKLTIIYVARQFWIKGGLIALEVLSKIKEKYDVNVIFISDVDEKVRKAYPSIEIKGLMPQNKVFDLMSKSDVFFYPSMVDTFGFALLEAMSFGLPILSVKTEYTKNVEEIIKEGKHGFLINIKDKPNYYKMGENEKQIANQLYNKLSLLIENKKLRENISKNCLNEIKTGKFSIKARNEKYAKIYSRALSA